MQAKNSTLTKEKQDILNLICKELKGIAEGVFYNDDKRIDELCIYVIVKEHFDKFYSKVIKLEESINKNHELPVSMHIWASQGRPLDKCRPPGTTQWVPK